MSTDEYSGFQLTGILRGLESRVCEVWSNDWICELLQIPGNNQGSVGQKVVELVVRERRGLQLLDNIKYVGFTRRWFVNVSNIIAVWM